PPGRRLLAHWACAGGFSSAVPSQPGSFSLARPVHFGSTSNTARASSSARDAGPLTAVGRGSASTSTPSLPSLSAELLRLLTTGTPSRCRVSATPAWPIAERE